MMGGRRSACVYTASAVATLGKVIEDFVASANMIAAAPTAIVATFATFTSVFRCWLPP